MQQMPRVLHAGLKASCRALCDHRYHVWTRAESNSVRRHHRHPRGMICPRRLCQRHRHRLCPMHRRQSCHAHLNPRSRPRSHHLCRLHRRQTSLKRHQPRYRTRSRRSKRHYRHCLHPSRCHPLATDMRPTVAMCFAGYRLASGGLWQSSRPPAQAERPKMRFLPRARRGSLFRVCGALANPEGLGAAA